MDCNPRVSSIHGDSPGKNTGVGCHFLLQGIFLTQGSNPVPSFSCIDRRVLYHCATWEAQILSKTGSLEFPETLGALEVVHPSSSLLKVSTDSERAILGALEAHRKRLKGSIALCEACVSWDQGLLETSLFLHLACAVGLIAVGVGTHLVLNLFKKKN